MPHGKASQGIVETVRRVKHYQDCEKSSLTSMPSYDKALMIETLKSMFPLENDERFIEVAEGSSTLNEAVDKMIDGQSEGI